LDAAHAAFPSWSNTSVAERSNVLLKMADLIEQNNDRLALIEVGSRVVDVSSPDCVMFVVVRPLTTASRSEKPQELIYRWWLTM
jgi:hypothetical protein